MIGSQYMEEQIIHMNSIDPSFNDQNQLIENTYNELSYQANQNDPKWGYNRPFNFANICSLYASPQPTMLIVTFCITIIFQVVILKFVFYGIHFYIGIFLCLFILYLLFSLGFSNPGVAFAEYQKMQAHLDLGKCSDKCWHPSYQTAQKTRFCNRCSIYVDPGTRHCTMCNCCVVEFDHHCVFIGKCVGGKNMGTFKLFLFTIFGTLVYGLVSSLTQLDNIRALNKHL